MLFRQEGEVDKIGKSRCRGNREIKEIDSTSHQKEVFKDLFAISKISFMDFDYQRNAESLNHSIAFARFDRLLAIESSVASRLAGFDRLRIHDSRRWFSFLT